MSLDVHIVEPITGKIDPELSVSVGVEVHGLLFDHANMRSDNFPLLCRMHDYYSDTDYPSNELESLIAEIERAVALFGAGTPVTRFLGPFHSVCVTAFARRKDVALIAD